MTPGRIKGYKILTVDSLWPLEGSSVMICWCRQSMTPGRIKGYNLQTADGLWPLEGSRVTISWRSTVYDPWKDQGLQSPDGRQSMTPLKNQGLQSLDGNNNNNNNKHIQMRLTEILLTEQVSFEQCFEHILQFGSSSSEGSIPKCG